MPESRSEGERVRLTRDVAEIQEGLHRCRDEDSLWAQR